ncbi:NifB/NifX family molybdenum-iron cluster-binding protein [uncultured Acetobacterium sp.]|jgi:Dinitrogenase iron-molybdenum cofactor.|uniref:NifB/NifX family molybdenum-iron cluster-binding protein n=1 Tax=uncultured Acetobacterium sp. TaxID=217139 RepID=UPI0026006AB7|nr:NifB/NifX family molybdenum-iron cluster-binding protein [uncultured Acetobacterium sp.]MDD3306296.1 NifB/NifX family molybdenum-iron cluster-binding protein [Acetobacterium sp.]
MRIAAVSSDGKLINQHFGQARDFYIFDIMNEGYKFLGIRTGKPFCSGGEHDDGELYNAVDLISDCDYLLAVQVGHGAQKELKNHGIMVKITRGIFKDCLYAFYKELETEGLIERKGA